MPKCTEEDGHAASNLMLDLIDLDAKAKAAGHSLVEILVKAASTQFGADVRPDPRPEDDAEVETEAATQAGEA